jgi:hypothetical protein
MSIAIEVAVVVGSVAAVVGLKRKSAQVSGAVLLSATGVIPRRHIPRPPRGIASWPAAYRNRI